MPMTAGASKFPAPAPWQLHWAYKIRSATVGMSTMPRQVSTMYPAVIMILRSVGLLMQTTSHI